MKKDNIVEIIYLLIRELGIPVTYKSIQSELLKHPHSNTVLAISDVLKGWAVPNVAFELSFAELIEKQFSGPFIAFFSNNEFVLVHELTPIEAIISNQEIEKKRISIEEFGSVYYGTILLAEKEVNSGEFDYKAKLRKERVDQYRYPVIIIFTIIALLSYFITHINLTEFGIFKIVLFIIKSLGLLITILLLIQSVDKTNPLIRRMCGSSNKKNSKAILSSKAAQVLPEVSWSEIGFIYFFGTFLALSFNNNNIALLQFLGVLNLLSLPYTFYSVFYQWRIAKQWCIFCCVVQALLWFEFLLFFQLSYLESFRITLNDSISLLICLLAPVALWVVLKPSLLMAQEVKSLRKSLKAFKFSEKYFNMRLTDLTERPYPLPIDTDSIVMGDLNAEHTITLVSNPYCTPCSSAHYTLENIMGTRNDIKFQLVFLTKDAAVNDPGSIVARHLMSIGREGIHNLKDVTASWYSNMDYEKLIKDYPVIEHIDNQILTQHNKYCRNADIHYTPTILINGRTVPEEYSPEDIKYLI